MRVTAGGGMQDQMLRSGGSYESASELVLTFGLGAAAQADAIEVRWPSGQTDTVEKCARGSDHHDEGRRGVGRRAGVEEKIDEPQRLKPNSFGAAFGTTKVVP